MLFSLQGSPPFLKLDFGLCARVSQRSSFPLSPRSNFPPGQRFPLPNHVTSGCLSPRSLFPPGQRFPIPNHVTSGCLSPRSPFSPGPRFPIPLPVMTSLDQSEASMVPIRAPFTTLWHKFCGCKLSEIRALLKMHRTVFGSFLDVIGLNRQLLRL